MQCQRVKSCLRVRPKQCEVCFTVSDVGVDLPSIVGLDPLPTVGDFSSPTSQINGNFECEYLRLGVTLDGDIHTVPKTELWCMNGENRAIILATLGNHHVFGGGGSQHGRIYTGKIRGEPFPPSTPSCHIPCP